MTMKKSVLGIVLLIFFVFIQGSTFVIDAAKNAVMHNEKGVRFLEDGYLASAIVEFKLAIALNPKSAATATFYNNLGTAYLRIHKYNWAASSFKNAISLNPNFLEYYKNLARTYKAQNLLSQEINKNIKQLKKDRSNSSAWLMLGLMYEEINYNYDALISFREFKKLEPDLILTKEVNNVINKLENIK